MLATMPEPLVDPQLLAELIRARRSRQGLTQDVAAGRAGIGIQTWRNLESGRPVSHRDGTLDKVEASLGWPVGTLRKLVGVTGPVDGAITEGRLRALEQHAAECVAFRERLTRAVRSDPA